MVSYRDRRRIILAGRPYYVGPGRVFFAVDPYWPGWQLRFSMPRAHVTCGPVPLPFSHRRRHW